MPGTLDTRFSKDRKRLERLKQIGDKLYIDFFTGETFIKLNSFLYQQMPSGLTYFKDFINQQDLEADFSLGSPTITVSRGSTNPASYIDADGHVQIITTSDTPRFTQGYYDETGFNLAPGLLLEGSSKNNWSHSEDLTNWSKSGATVEQVAIENPTGGSGASLVHSNSGLRLVYQGLTLTGPVTFSCWIRNGSIRFWKGSANGPTFTNNSDEWIRCVYTNGGGGFANYGIQVNSDTYIWGAQLESNKAFATSYIPTTASKPTRNAETLTVPVSSNFSQDDAQSLLLGLRPIMLPDEQPSDNRVFCKVEIDSNNNWELRHGTNAEDRIELKTESSGSEVNSVSSSEPFSSTRLGFHSLIGTMDITDKVKLSVDGNTFTESTGDYVIPSGSLPGNISFLPDTGQGLILTHFGIWNRALDQSEATEIHNIISEGG